VKKALFTALWSILSMDPYRLPDSVIPSRYELTLTPDLPTSSFTGEVTIALTVREPVTEILLNATELRIESAILTPSQQHAEITLDEASERCRFRFAHTVPTGGTRLHVRFQGTLNDKLRGFYRSRVRAPSGQERWLAATQFEATDARRAFPCWDEPGLKAVFSSTLVIDPALQAISNTSIVENRIEAGKRIVRFADTIPMSTYLVAFIVGAFESTDPVMVGNTPVRVWCVPGKQPLTRFAQEIAVFSLRLFEDYYGRNYPGDKLDLIAIPDFAAGAMENLGAITFRETALLVDESTATHQEKERVADVVAHENAHMWFGDLVTMRWWNGLWLNEAFATFMEMLAVDAWKPAWQRWVTFGVSRAAALTVDGLHASRPIEFPVQAPQDAEAMFDVLTYEKGASVLRMLEQYLGPAVFQTGVREYIDRHAFANTETEDLWKALASASDLPIPAIMDGWIFQEGYPVLSVHREGEELVLRQQRFCYLPLAKGDPQRLWRIPVQVRFDAVAGSQVRRVLLDQVETRLPLAVDTRLVLLNEGGHGFYRVRYSAELLGALLDRLPTLSAIERFNLVNDAWANVLAGLLSMGEYLDLTTRFQGERDRNVWSIVLASLTVLSRIVEDDDRPGLQRLVRDRLGPAVRDLMWQPRPGEDELIGQLRGDLLRANGTLGDDASVQGEAVLVFAGGQADASVASAAIAILAHTGDANRYEEFLSRFRSARTPQEEQRYLMALAGFRPIALVERTLAISLDGTVRTQDAPFLLRALLQGVHSRDRAWTFVQKHWDEMAERFPGPGIRRLCEGVLGLASEQWEKEVRAFFHDRQIKLGGKTLEQYLEQLHIAVELRRREGEALHDYVSRMYEG
jgi:puromycin-sensitive aminopeptidase